MAQARAFRQPHCHLPLVVFEGVCYSFYKSCQPMSRLHSGVHGRSLIKRDLRPLNRLVVELVYALPYVAFTLDQHLVGQATGTGIRW